MVYNYLVDSNIRAEMSIGLENKIIIIDEAHNIVAACKNSIEASISQDHIDLAIDHLKTHQLASR
jgi:Rad3-related DNA helicase